MIAIYRLIFFTVLALFSTLSLGKPTILVLGDSLSAAYQIAPESGWVSLMKAKINPLYPHANIVNSSIVGDTTANGLQRLPSLLDTHKPDIVIVELGGNDGLRGYPIYTIKQNLENMIKQCLTANAKVLLVGIKLPPNYGDIYNKQFENNFIELSERYKVPLVPFFLDKVALVTKLMQADRIHPNAQAQPILLENIWPYIEPLLKQS